MTKEFEHSIKKTMKKFEGKINPDTIQTEFEKQKDRLEKTWGEAFKSGNFRTNPYSRMQKM